MPVTMAGDSSLRGSLSNVMEWKDKLAFDLQIIHSLNALFYHVGSRGIMVCSLSMSVSHLTVLKSKVIMIKEVHENKFGT